MNYSLTGHLGKVPVRTAPNDVFVSEGVEAPELQQSIEVNQWGHADVVLMDPVAGRYVLRGVADDLAELQHRPTARDKLCGCPALPKRRRFIMLSFQVA